MTERRVLVTGASSGIGMATAHHLSDLGFTTIALVRDEPERTDLARAAREWGSHVDVVVADLSTPGTAAIVDELTLYGLVNNAAYMNAGLIEDVAIEDARPQFEAMVFTPIELARRALPAMLERGEGKIVNITSAAVHTSTPLTGWYQAAKAALRELNDALRIELRSTGVDVVDVEPGGVQTGIWARATSELERRKTMSRRAPEYDRALAVTARFRSRMTAPEQVAATVGRVLTMAHPRAHVRVGRGALVLRLASEVLPDRVTDRASARLSGVR